MGTRMQGRTTRPSLRTRLAYLSLAFAAGVLCVALMRTHRNGAALEPNLDALVLPDLRVSLRAPSSGPPELHALSPEMIAGLVADPAVLSVSRTVGHQIGLSGQPVALQGVDRMEEVVRQLWVVPPPEGVQFLRSEGVVEPVWASEPLARRLGVGAGAFLEIPTGHEPRSAVVTGIFVATEPGAEVLVADRLAIEEWFVDAPVVRLDIRLQPGADAGEVRRRWQARHPELVIRTRAEQLDLLRRVAYAP